MTDPTPTVKFFPHEYPALETGEYTLTVEQTVNQTAPNNFRASQTFAVAGERFAIDPAEIHSVFPPDLANGEYAGVLAHVVFTRRTLPWERHSTVHRGPWLAVLVVDEDELKRIVAGTMTAADLVTAGEQVRVKAQKATDPTGVGALPPTYLSYPEINPLDYGESPETPCTVIDVPADLFASIAPSAADLPYLAEIREVDTTSSEDHTSSTLTLAVVTANRVAVDDARSHAFLVSLEHMEELLPADDGRSGLPAGISMVRLLAYRHWSFVANTMGGTLRRLLENLNPASDEKRISSLRLPLAGDPHPPSPDRVRSALDHQAAGTLTGDDAGVLVDNALLMGYVPMCHRLRNGVDTVSWYRGPLVPHPVATEPTALISCPDAANRYDPQTGMFDVSYGAAWQLGQLLALQNTGYAIALYNWKRHLHAAKTILQESDDLRRLFGGGPPADSAPPAGFIDRWLGPTGPRADDDPPPAVVVDFLAGLRLLNGLPFHYLVADEAMLPRESMRVFHIDGNWIRALVHGALSLGRGSSADLERDREPMLAATVRSIGAARARRRNPHPPSVLAASASSEAEGADPSVDITGILLRSQVVAGWPRLLVEGYSKEGEPADRLRTLRMARLSDQVLLCLFEGPIRKLAFHEPPEQLHSGVLDAPGGGWATTLRWVNGKDAGKQILDKGGEPVTEPVPVRADERTLRIGAAATGLRNALNSRYQQGITDLTSVELGLELVLGMTRVEFVQVAD